jgi:hypothetical protein
MIVIPDIAKGDRRVESSGVKAPEGLASGRRPVAVSGPSGGRASRRVVANGRSRKPRNGFLTVHGRVGVLGVPNVSVRCEGQCRRRRNWAKATGGLPGVLEHDTSTQNDQRKLGTSRGRPRRTRTAKTPRISCNATKSRCARERGAWGRLSDDGPGHYNPDRSEGPWGRATLVARAAVLHPPTVPTQSGAAGLAWRARRTDTNRTRRRECRCRLNWKLAREGTV